MNRASRASFKVTHFYPFKMCVLIIVEVWWYGKVHKSKIICVWDGHNSSSKCKRLLSRFSGGSRSPRTKNCRVSTN